MNKILFFPLLILIYLGLSNSASLNEKNFLYITHKEDLQNYFTKKMSTLILESYRQTGFFIKTHTLTLKLIHAYLPARTFQVKASRSYWEEVKDSKGLSIFRRGEQVDFKHAFPGVLFLGNLNYGSWKTTPSGINLWHFDKSYQHLSKLLKWNLYFSHSPRLSFYKKLKNENFLDRKMIELANQKEDIPKINYLKVQIQKILRIPPFTRKRAQHE